MGTYKPLDENRRSEDEYTSETVFVLWRHLLDVQRKKKETLQ